MIVNIQHVQKYFGAEMVLSDITFQIGEGESIGIIGRNGSGKSTVLKLIAGNIAPDQGEISIRKGTKIGYLSQTKEAFPGATVYDVLLQGYSELMEWQARMTTLEAMMATQQSAAMMEKYLEEYSELQEKFDRQGGYEMDARIHQIANGVGIPDEHFARCYATLSGGEKTKVDLASLLLERPDLLLLDEPTNHLDLAATEWLEDHLRSYKGTSVIVSHDRYFLDRIIDKIVEVEDGEAMTYHTDYSGYQREKQEMLLRQFQEYKDQQKQIKQMKEAIRRYTEWGNIGGNEKFFRRAAAIQKALDRMDKVKRPVLERKAADFAAGATQRSGNDVIVLDHIGKSFGETVLFQGVSGLIEYGDKVALIGGNGTGKSTLFRLLLGDDRPDAGEIKLGTRVKPGYLAQDAAPASGTTVLQYFRDQIGVEEGEARHLLAKYLFYGADVFKSVAGLSGGEWTRLRLAVVMHHAPNLLLLDEPTNHLDIPSREALEDMLEEFSGTLLAISHDRYFINRLAGKTWELRDRQLFHYEGNFEAYKEETANRQRKEAETKGAAAKKTASRSKPIDAQRHQARLQERAEERIERLESRSRELDALLMDEKIGTDSERLTELLAEREQVQRELETLYEQWFQLQATEKE